MGAGRYDVIVVGARVAGASWAAVISAATSVVVSFSQRLIAAWSSASRFSKCQ